MAYDPDYYLKNKERHAEYGKKYREANKNKERLRHKKYREQNKERHADYERKRRALKRSLKHDFYTTQQVIEKYGSSCYLCDKEIDMKAERRSGRNGWENGLHIDHIVPLVDGGDDTLENVRPSHGLCNAKKINMVKLI